MNLPKALNELSDKKIWCAWRKEPTKKQDGTQDIGKIPYNPIANKRLHGKKGSPEYMNQLTDYETVNSVFKAGNYDGVGCVMQNGYIGLDIDHCIHDGIVSTEGEEIIRMFNSYTEISPSGNGIRIIAKGIKHGEKTRRSYNGQTYEIYDSPKGNYLTITGNVYGEEKPIQTNQKAIDWYYQNYINIPENTVKTASEPNIYTVPVEYTIQSKKRSDEEVLTSLLKDPVGYALFYSTAEGKDHSAEDLALCNKLAFYCQKDKEQIDRLFRQSTLFQTMKEEKPGIKKWDNIHDGIRTYGQITIDKAVNDVTDSYGKNETSNPVKSEANTEIITADTGEMISILKPFKASEVIEKPIDWLVPQWIPQGYVSVMASDGGIGKTTVSASIAAPVSGGYVPAIFNHGNTDIRLTTNKKPLVLVLTAEASMSASYKAKLRMYKHCNMSNIEYLDCNTGRKNARLGDRELINYIRIRKPILIIIDPLQSFLPYNADMNSKTSFNNSLEEISKACSNAETALLLITHTNKMSGVYGRNRLNGTSDIWDLARSVMFLNIEGKEKGRIFFSHEKVNDAEMQNTIILSNQNGMITFESEDSENRTDEDFHSGIRKNSETHVSVKEECAESIREIFKLFDTDQMTDTELKSILKNNYGYSDHAIRYGKNFLISTGELKREQKGNGKEGSKKEMILKFCKMPE